MKPLILFRRSGLLRRYPGPVVFHLDDMEPVFLEAPYPYGSTQVFASTDPVAIDAACYDAVAKAGKKFKGAEQLDYAEKIGLGSRDYELIEL